MAFLPEGAAVVHGIQLAVAPVFLLTAVSGLIGAVAHRLGRIIDRARLVEERTRTTADEALLARAVWELRQLRMRGHLANGSIGLLTCCAFTIGLTIVLLFLGETAALQVSRWSVIGFLTGIAFFMGALLCFLAETLLAARILDFQAMQRT